MREIAVPHKNSLETFDRYRSLLFAIAYRMLGSVMDAEDMVQETFLRWQQTSQQEIESTKAYLTTIVTRLCIDYLRSARVRREQYVGPWLPEPIVTEASIQPMAKTELADSLSIAFLILLERLSPIERAVFLLKEAFEYDYNAIAEIVEKNPTHCRQIARRARKHIQSQRSRFPTTPQKQEQLTQKFMQAFSQGELQGFIDLLAEDVVLWSDGGGKVNALLKPLQGARKVAGFLRAIYRLEGKLGKVSQAELVRVNGQSGIVYSVEGEVQTIVAMEIVENYIQSLYFVRNPDKIERSFSDRKFTQEMLNY